MPAESPRPDSWPAAAEELRLINNLVLRISQVREVNHIMNIILSELLRVTEADQGVISLVSKRRQDDLETVVRSRDTSSREFPFRLSQSLAGWVLTHRELLSVDDLGADDRFSDIDTEGGRFKSAICCPLVVRDETIGVIAFTRSADREPFTPDHCRMVGIMAAQSASILANAQLLAQLAAQNTLLETSYKQLQEEHTKLRQKALPTVGFEHIIGSSTAIRQVLALASKFSASDSPVLITGETGTGKELVARALHESSPRRERPFVVKNCGIKTESLLESELFGHVKGAFTGADRDKPGLFREAQNGTVFLDEIGDAPLSTQAAILRVIQSGEIRPVGASRTEVVNVRVLSATHRQLKDEITKSTFREDLFYRLSTFTIHMPPLRDRREDIPLLVQHALARLRIQLKMDSLTVSTEALDALQRYAWPGNIRQLEHEVERAAVVCNPSETIELFHLSPEVLDGINESPGLGAPHGSLRLAVEQLERTMIASALAEQGGNIMRTAEALGLTRKGLKDKMARYGLKAGEAG